LKSGRNTRLKIINIMKQLFLLAIVSLMFVSCVNRNEQVQEEEVLIEEVDSTLLEEEVLETEEVEAELEVTE
jgi:PBP1b-binding outer membrane lipoprotein LpoB